MPIEILVEGTNLTLLALHHSGGGRRGCVEVPCRKTSTIKQQTVKIKIESLYYTILNGSRPEYYLPSVGKGALLIIEIAARVWGCVNDR